MRLVCPRKTISRSLDMIGPPRDVIGWPREVIPRSRDVIGRPQDSVFRPWNMIGLPAVDQFSVLGHDWSAAEYDWLAARGNCATHWDIHDWSAWGKTFSLPGDYWATIGDNSSAARRADWSVAVRTILVHYVTYGVMLVGELRPAVRGIAVVTVLIRGLWEDAGRPVSVRLATSPPDIDA